MAESNADVSPIVPARLWPSPGLPDAVLVLAWWLSCVLVVAEDHPAAALWLLGLAGCGLVTIFVALQDAVVMARITPTWLELTRLRGLRLRREVTERPTVAVTGHPLLEAVRRLENGRGVQLWLAGPPGEVAPIARDEGQATVWTCSRVIQTGSRLWPTLIVACVLYIPVCVTWPQLPPLAAAVHLGFATLVAWVGRRTWRTHVLRAQAHGPWIAVRTPARSLRLARSEVATVRDDSLGSLLQTPYGVLRFRPEARAWLASIGLR